MVIRTAREGVRSRLVPAAFDASQIQTRGIPTATTTAATRPDRWEPVALTMPCGVFIWDTQMYRNTKLYPKARTRHTTRAALLPRQARLKWKFAAHCGDNP